MLVVDSNLWIYYADATLPEHATVKGFLDPILEGDEPVAVNTVIQMEVAHYLIKRLGSAAGQVKARTFLGLDVEVDPLDPPRTVEAVSHLARYSDVGIGGRDATILATLRALRTTRLATHDQSFGRVDWVQVEDPLSGSPC